MSDAPAAKGITVVEDFDAAEDFDKKHTPYVEFCGGGDGKTAVCVTVGHEVPHPNEPDHFIQYIEIEVDGKTYARFDLTPVVSSPKVSVELDVESGTTLRAIEYCNIHGVFAYEVTV
jgi:superoxide reductase